METYNLVKIVYQGETEFKIFFSLKFLADVFGHIFSPISFCFLMLLLLSNPHYDNRISDKKVYCLPKGHKTDITMQSSI